MAVNVNIDCGKIDNLTKQLIGSSLMADLITHFNNPENQKRFEEWKKQELERSKAECTELK